VRHLPRAWSTCAIAGAVIVSTAIPAAAAATTWSLVPSQSSGTQSGLGSIDLLNAASGWAVGSTASGGGLIERYNGTQWTIVSSPDILDHNNPNNFGGLSDVDVVSAADAFAVGTSSAYLSDGILHYTPVIERWNGTAWTRMSVPAAPADTELAAVKAFSSTDVWALGRAGTMGFGGAVALHWNGSAWASVAIPSPGSRDTTITELTATATNDLWAVGYSRDLPYGNRARHSVTLHWNGSMWSRVTSPDVGTVTYLRDAVAISPTDVWAVGSGSSSVTGAIALHWNGSSWTSVTPPGLSTLDSVTALSATDVWAGGTGTDGQAYLANWRGSAWTVTAAPRSGNLPSGYVTGLAAISPSSVWGVGYTYDSTTGAEQPNAMRTTTG
jgi:hypothetical protein